MTDYAIPGRTVDAAAIHAARARVKARYRAETRFKFYGLTAIALAAAFLLIVLADILMKGLPAFTQHWLVVEVFIDPAEIDPQGNKDPAVIRSGDFQALARNALRNKFPEATDRSSRRLLDGILSSGAGDSIRERVIANPNLIGQTVKIPVLVSDDADLYLKGYGTQIVREKGRGIATPSGTSGEITVASSTNDFAGELANIKRAFSRLARSERAEAQRLRLSIKDLEASKAKVEKALAAARTSNAATEVAASEQRLAQYSGEIENLARIAGEIEQKASALQARFDNPSGREQLDESSPSLMVAINGGLVKATNVESNQITGTVLIPLSSAGPAQAGLWNVVVYSTPESNRRVTDREVAWLENLRDQGAVERKFNWAFFTSGDSREPELAGIRGALVGSVLTLAVTLFLCLPIGVAAAIYLEEFAPKNRLTELIEVNINNLAAVPSIVFGLLGLAVFLNFMGLPRSAPLVGGLVLALLVLPTIIIASRAALRAVPPSIKEAALGVGASHQQAVFHHVLPLAAPGIMTGTIIGMAHALGETAPLLMIGMVAFIVELPTGITDAATVLPVQIYLWSDLPEIAFQSKTAAAIIVLLLFLFVMNGSAIYLRKKFERRW
jgi:phosphate transport system permease protein